jgi:hypothetical protein
MNHSDWSFYYGYIGGLFAVDTTALVICIGYLIGIF